MSDQTGSTRGHPSGGDAAFRVQNQIRRNAQDMQEYLADLGSWEKSIKKKDRQLSRKAGASASRPVRTDTSAVATRPIRRSNGPVTVGSGPPPIESSTVKKNARHAEGEAHSRISTLAPAQSTISHVGSNRSNCARAAAAATATHEETVSAAGHTHDQGYQKWAKFDVDAALRDDDEDSTAKHSGNSDSDNDRYEENTATPSTARQSSRCEPATVVNRLPGHNGRENSSCPVEMPSRATANPRDMDKEERERGNRMFTSGDFGGAVKCYTRCMGINSNNVLAFSNRAMAYLKLKEFVKAEADCDSALRIDPRHVKSLQRRAVARNALGKHRAALGDLQAAGEIDPTSKQVRKDISKTLEMLRAVSRRAPKQHVTVEAEPLPAPQPRPSLPLGAAGEDSEVPLAIPAAEVTSIDLAALRDANVTSATPTIIPVASLDDRALSGSKEKVAPVSSVISYGEDQLPSDRELHQQCLLRKTTDDSGTPAVHVAGSSPEVRAAAHEESVQKVVASATSRSADVVDVHAGEYSDGRAVDRTSRPSSSESVSATASKPRLSNERAASFGMATARRVGAGVTKVSSATSLEGTHGVVEPESGVLSPEAGTSTGGSQPHVNHTERSKQQAGILIDGNGILGGPKVANPTNKKASLHSSVVRDNAPDSQTSPPPMVLADHDTAQKHENFTTKQVSHKRGIKSGQAAPVAWDASAAVAALPSARPLPTSGYQLEHMWRSAGARNADPDARLELLRIVPPSSIGKMFRRTPLDVELLEDILQHLGAAFLPRRPTTAVRWLTNLAKASRFTMTVSLMSEGEGREAVRELIVQLGAHGASQEKLDTLKKQYML